MKRWTAETNCDRSASEVKRRLALRPVPTEDGSEVPVCPHRMRSWEHWHA